VSTQSWKTAGTFCKRQKAKTSLNAEEAFKGVFLFKRDMTLGIDKDRRAK